MDSSHRGDNAGDGRDGPPADPHLLAIKVRENAVLVGEVLVNTVFGRVRIRISFSKNKVNKQEGLLARLVFTNKSATSGQSTTSL